MVTPSTVVPLHSVFVGRFSDPSVTLAKTRSFVQEQLKNFPTEITRYESPRPYDVMVSLELYRFLHELWEREAPIEERS